MNDTELMINPNVRAWDPFATMQRMLRYDPLANEARTATRAAYFPRFEVAEQPSGYTLYADVPGLQDADLDITVSGTQISISGERRADPIPDDGKVHVYERAFGKFVRTFTLPADADFDSITANLDDGVLCLTVPKRDEAKPKKISLTHRLKNALKS